jgi:hypothetical protein
MKDEEHPQLCKATRHKLKKLSNGPEWGTPFDAQFGAHHESGAMLPPVLWSSIEFKHGTRFLQIHWAKVLKGDGIKKARA